MFWTNVAHASSFMPPQASEFAPKFDALYGFLVIISVIACILVIGGMVYFAIKYRRRSDTEKSAYISHNTTLEFLWSFIPFVLFMIVFVWGWVVYHDMRNMPEDAFEVHVVGEKWRWDFLYKSGRRATGEFYVPVNEPVKLIMSSRDVIHSFFVPSFRIKQDVVPGMYSALHFTATKEGSFNVFCTEYCGDGHSSMLGRVNVVSRERFNQWLLDDPYRDMSIVEIGQQVFQGRCTVCHHVGSQERLVGPGLLGLYGRERVFTDGSRRIADENYIRESILYPDDEIVEGYSPHQMPSFQGQLDEQELLGLVEYIKSLQ